MGKKRRKKHWRDHLVNNLLPARFQLIDYQPLINKIVEVARGETIRPLDIYRRFFKSFSFKLNCKGVNTPLLLRSYSTHLLSLQKEDLEQQCFLYLMELWDFYTFTWSKHGTATSTVFYDFARANLARWIGIYVATEINNSSAEGSWAPLLPQSYEMEDPQVFRMDLGWVMLKANDGVFGRLTIKQKYLLYLRYSKELTIEQISALIQQHRVNIEQEFSIINTILYGGRRVTTRT